jgi:hypothetical protein
MAEQSHRDEMNAAIRAQRERHSAPRTIVAPADEPAVTPAPDVAPEPEATEAEPPRKSMLDRLRGR